MDLKIIIDAENKLFSRREIEGEIHADSAPSRQDVVKIISEKFSVKPEVVKIKTIKGKFGEKIFLIVANIYKSKEEKDKVELKKKKDTEAEKKQEVSENIESVQEDKKEVSEEVEESKLEETENGENPE
ncbi:MAG: hypothetical protein KKF67_03455 [Nanoarchaeota archaeon]|nr:hypothetical protein [Nanoarchaeota archaeon]